MATPERRLPSPPATFDAFRERRTRGQRRRALFVVLVGPPYRVYARLLGRR